MLTSANHLDSDPKAMCGIIAKTALSVMNTPNSPASEAVEATWLRILDMYKYGAFRHTGTPRGMFDFEPLVRQPALEGRDSGMDLQKAIGLVHKEMEPDRTGEEFVASIADAVRACFGAGHGAPLQSQREQMRRFLELFRSSLAQS
jgi:hypothetical protein